MCGKIFFGCYLSFDYLAEEFFLYQRKLTTNKKEAKERTKDKG